MPIEACSYLRVSSTGQLSGDGYPRQREAISKFAAANGYELIAEFSDDISGKTELDNRPGLAACMERIENNGVKVVIVESSDRLARDAMVSELIIREFKASAGRAHRVRGQPHRRRRRQPHGGTDTRHAGPDSRVRPPSDRAQTQGSSPAQEGPDRQRRRDLSFRP
jgi:hypothetical protein